MAIAFGTDGIRGVADVELTSEVARALGRAAAQVLRSDRWLIGCDTRASGPGLARAFAEGVGTPVIDLGVLPTPGVAYHAQRENLPAAVVSASHNPWTDNGIKVLAAGGRKLSDATEEAIAGNMTAASPPFVADLTPHPDPIAPYVEHLTSALEGRGLGGMRLVIDCANGAASAVAPLVFRTLGAELIVLNAEPDGTNINADCGSTHPHGLQAAVVEHGADAGLAFDGDADRVLAVDAGGALVDGDHIIALCAEDLQSSGKLRHSAVAVTVMSNMGLRLALADAGIDVVETAVGDRYVLEALAARDLALGGEQSGHVIFSDLATTGDGILTGLMLLDGIRRSGRTLETAAAQAMTRLPQVLRNVRVADRAGLDAATAVWDAVAAAEARLAGRGRVLLRPSGTEPLIRVMVEAPTLSDAQGVADELGAVVLAALGDG